MKHIFRFTAALAITAALAGAQSRSKLADTPDMKEIRDYRLSLDVIQRYVTAVTKASADPGAKKCLENSPPGNAPTLDAGEKILNSCPAAVAIIRSAGIKPREFLLITGALIGDVMAVGMKKQGAIKQYPASISPENAAFVEQNYDKIQAMIKPLNDMGDK